MTASLVLLALLQTQAPASGASAAWAERELRLPIVGSGVAYVPKRPTTRVVLFVSGDGGWNLGVVDMARRMASNALVVGISYPALRKATAGERSCWYPAGDLEVITQAAEKQLGLEEYVAPLLVGYSSGATLVYAALAAAPASSFAGGMSLGFCPDLPTDRAVCAAGGWRPSFDPRKHESLLPVIAAVPRDWYILNGVQDQVCAFDQTRTFLANIGRAHLVEIQGTGHGFGRTARWGSAFDQSLDALWRATERPTPPPAAAPTAPALQDSLDALELPLTYRWADRSRAYLIFLSGDGGWAGLDQGIAKAAADSGVSVIGLNSLRYFWREKTAAVVATDLQRIVARVSGSGLPVFMGGYSFGASVLPVALATEPATARTAVSGLVLVSPSSDATFEIDPLDWIRTARERGGGVTAALRALSLPVLCLAGTDEEDGACLEPSAAGVVRIERLPGSHHYHGDYAAVGRTVAGFIDAALDARRPPNTHPDITRRQRLDASGRRASSPPARSTAETTPTAPPPCRTRPGTRTAR
jgi:type IV secretory pathway VirJ component